jgi:hypothetical protein
MGPLLASLFILVQLPVADPTFFVANSPQCLLHALSHGNPLPLIVRTPSPSCPWSADEAALVEIGRAYSHYSWWNFERTNNLETAAARVDGQMLLPGEEFSYNEVVGERTEKTGFKEAKIIAEFGYTDGIGGGVCQPASNLHAAALMAGLEIVERWPHRFRVKYVAPGLDATVDYGKKDLRIRNNTPYPVVFQMGRIEKGELLTRVMAPARIFRVWYKYKVLEETPSDSVRFSVAGEKKDLVEFFGRPGLLIEKIIYRNHLLTGKSEKLKIKNDAYSPSPWSLRVAKLPDGKKVKSGLSKGEIARLLKGSKWTVEQARFPDVDQQDGKYVVPVHIPAKRLALFQRYSQMEEFVAQAADGACEAATVHGPVLEALAQLPQSIR